METRKRRFEINGEGEATKSIADAKSKAQRKEAIEKIMKCESFALIYQNKKDGGVVSEINGMRHSMMLGVGCLKLANELKESLFNHVMKDCDLQEEE